MTYYLAELLAEELSRVTRTEWYATTEDEEIFLIDFDSAIPTARSKGAWKLVDKAEALLRDWNPIMPCYYGFIGNY